MPSKKFFIIDFDSTFTSVEALDVLCEIALKDAPNKNAALEQIVKITNQGMAGEISLSQSLEERIRILKAHRDHIPLLIEQLKRKVSKSFRRNEAFIQQNAERIFIVSNGFKEFIVPVVATFGIVESHVFANNFIFDVDGNIIGYDKTNLLSSNHGKAKEIESLNLPGKIIVIGDGYTDYEIKSMGCADTFIAFTENISRPKVTAKGDYIANNFEEVLQLI